MAEAPDLNEILQRLEVAEHKLGIYFAPSAEALLEELLEKLEPLSLQNILREVDAKVLALAMMGSKAPALRGIQAAMSKKSWGMIRDDVQYHLNLGVTEAAIRQAHLEMMSVVQKLVSLGKVALQVKDPSPALSEWQKLNTGSGTSFKKVEGLEAWKKDVLDKL